MFNIHIFKSLVLNKDVLIPFFFIPDTDSETKTCESAETDYESDTGT